MQTQDHAGEVPEAIVLILAKAVRAAARSGDVVSSDTVLSRVRADFPEYGCSRLLLEAALVREASRNRVAVQFD